MMQGNSKEQKGKARDRQNKCWVVTERQHQHSLHRMVERQFDSFRYAKNTARNNMVLFAFKTIVECLPPLHNPSSFVNIANQRRIPESCLNQL